MTRVLFILAVAFFASGPAMAQDAAPLAGDSAAGKTVFSRCTSCHDVGAAPKNRMGPYLTGVAGRPAASVDKFTYSKAMIAARDAGLVWTSDSLNAYLEGTHEYVPGTKMPEVMMRDATQRANLIAYLISLSPDFDPAKSVNTYAPPSAAANASSSAAPVQ